MIYLDSAATSLRKPPSVAQAVEQAVRRLASPGRGTHAPAMRAAELLYSCRAEAAALFHMDAPEQVIFTSNATHGLNIAVFSLVRSGMRVVMSGYEHNALLRPLIRAGAQPDICDAPPFDREGLLAFYRKHLPGADCAVVTHVSNVFGYTEPLEEISAMCRAQHVPLIVDAAQSAGVLDIDFKSLGADYLAVPGHKGLLGPQGTGLLLCRRSAEPLLFGGTGSYSDSLTMPETLPDRLEAGTHNVCGIAGLLEGIRYVRAHRESIRRTEERLLQRLTDGLSTVRGFRVISCRPEQVGAVSAVPESITAEALGEALGRAGIAVRTGLHCAPLAHKTAGTADTGTVRFSVCPFNTVREIDIAVAQTEKILKFGNKM